MPVISGRQLQLLLGVGVWCFSGVELGAQGVQATVHEGIFLRRQVVSVPVIDGETGDVAFDPTDAHRIYVLADEEAPLGGGVYRLDEGPDGMLIRGERIAAADHPSGVAFTANGDLWILRDLGAGGGYLIRIPEPRKGAPQSEVAISNFLTWADDDAKVLGVAPAGFSSDVVEPEDILIGEAGADSNAPNAIYAYSPLNPLGPPDAYDVLLVPPGGFPAFDDINLIDFDFAADGGSLFVLFANGDIVPVDASGGVSSPLEVKDPDMLSARALAVHPVDGRIWVGLDAPGEIRSIDPATGASRPEITFTRSSEAWPLAPIRFHPPSLRFRPDGRRLVVTDSQGQLWIFDAVDPAGNRPPVAHIGNGFPGQVVPLIDGVATFELDGSVSSDGDGGTQGLAHAWSQVSGPSVAVFGAPGAERTSVTVSASGIYTFALRVDDGASVENIATAQLGLGVLGLEGAVGGTFESFQAIPTGGVAGDVAFAPGPGGGLFALLDDVPEQGGGVYEVVEEPGQAVEEPGRFRRGRRIAVVDQPSSLVLVGGSLWLARDTDAASGPYLSVLRRPEELPAPALEPVIVNFAGPADDDPLALAVVPPGFPSKKALEGDILIVDAGADGDNQNAIYVLTPSEPVVDPAAYRRLFSTTTQLVQFFGGNIRDLAFSRNGTRLFVATATSGVVELDGEGDVVGPLATGGALLADVVGLATDPETGRLWIAERGPGQVWSLDIDTADAVLEIDLDAAFAGLPLPVELHAPSLAFSPDGRRLAVCDAGNRGWLWLFEKPEPPRSEFRRGDSGSSGLVEISDPIRLLNYLFLGGRAPDCLDAADGDDTGDLNLTDAVFVLSFLFLSGPTPPDPGPAACGPDPTADTLPECAGIQAGC